jgi:hypothetical protein
VTADDVSDYVRAVREKTQGHLQDLLCETETLCARVCVLEREVDQHRNERLRVEERIASIEEERLACLQKSADVEADNAGVLNLYVATLRLHGSRHHGDVLVAIHEIVTNLIGSEELAVFEVGPGRSGMRLCYVHGVDPALLEGVRFGEGTIGGCAQSGRAYNAEQQSSTAPAGVETDLTACIPLVVDGSVTGVVTIFKLLRHKPRLAPIDHELFTLLASQASIALHLRRRGRRVRNGRPTRR